MPDDNDDAPTEHDGDVDDTRITKERAEWIDQQMAKQTTIQQTISGEKPTNPLSEELETLKKENKALKRNRRKELLSQLDKKEAETYKESSLEVLEAIVEYSRNTPRRRGIQREEKKEEKTAKPLHIGGKNLKTGEWY
jgi:hypothetical protein